LALSRVPCQNSRIDVDLAFRARYAALWYSFIRPPRTFLRSILAVMSTASPGRRSGGSCCRPLMRTVPVIVASVLGQDLAEMPLAEDQHVIEALAAQRAHEPLRV
jgi:hypothetical protein